MSQDSKRATNSGTEDPGTGSSTSAVTEAVAGVEDDATCGFIVVAVQDVGGALRTKSWKSTVPSHTCPEITEADIEDDIVCGVEQLLAD